jgi:hypothetical protein
VSKDSVPQIEYEAKEPTVNFPKSGGREDDSSGMLRRVVSEKLTDVSKVYTASIIRAIQGCDGGSSCFPALGVGPRVLTVVLPSLRYREMFFVLCTVINVAFRDWNSDSNSVVYYINMAPSQRTVSFLAIPF